MIYGLAGNYRDYFFDYLAKAGNRSLHYENRKGFSQTTFG